MSNICKMFHKLFLKTLYNLTITKKKMQVDYDGMYL